MGSKFQETMPKASEGENTEALSADLTVSSLFGVSAKVVLITGGGSGIGAMMASGFVQNGAKVYIASRKDISAYATELTAKGPGTCEALQCDLAKESDAIRLVETLQSREGKLHVLINNIGTNYNAPVEEHSMEAFDKVMRLNVTALFALTRLCVPLLKAAATEADPSRVINISSVNGIQIPIQMNTFGYSTSKAAVLHLSKHLASALGPDLITVNSICPGPFPSRMMKSTLDAMGELIASGTALGRVGIPADMASAALFLASRAGSFLTGTEFAVDGGSLVSRSSL